MAQQDIVLITGASGALGAAAAQLLAAAGHHVVLGARRAGPLALLATRIRAAGGSAEWRTVDVTDADDVQGFVLAAHRTHGRIDVLVNAAGAGTPSRLDTLKLNEWDSLLDVNLRGMLYAVEAVQPLMRIAGAGHVINIAGGSGESGAGVLGAVNAGIHALSATLRLEERHLRVTVVAPGSADKVARAIACAVGGTGRITAGRCGARPIRLLTWAGDGPGTSAAQRRSPPPASPR